ncbi:hypothetical protein GW17_00056023 [Ensete ventricosum]|nr:hypothetical protein GW17_00056023 [Ensete ventricosum]
MADVADRIFDLLPYDGEDEGDDAFFIQEVGEDLSGDATATASVRFPEETLDSYDLVLLDGAVEKRSDSLSLDGSQYCDHDGSFSSRSAPRTAGGCPGSPLGENLRITEIESEEDRVMASVVDGEVGDDDLRSPLCSNCIRIEEEESVGLVLEEEGNDCFEWEEVDGCSCMMIDADEGGSASASRRSHGEELIDLVLEFSDDIGGSLAELDRGIPSSVNDRGAGAESSYLDDDEPYLRDDHDMNTSEFEVLYGQFVDRHGLPTGNPPAAKSVIMSLPSVIIIEEDLANGHALCAVCMDDISLKEKAKRLPCSHHFHGDCILPWLAIRNSCPVCRHELPTDDPDYENWKAQRSSPAGATTAEPAARYDYEMFPEI